MKSSYTSKESINSYMSSIIQQIRIKLSEDYFDFIDFYEKDGNQLYDLKIKWGKMMRKQFSVHHNANKIRFVVYDSQSQWEESNVYGDKIIFDSGYIFDNEFINYKELKTLYESIVFKYYTQSVELIDEKINYEVKHQ